MFFRKKGFTLLELVLVIAVIGILAAIIAPRFTSQGPKARVAQTKANLENLRTAVGMYQAEQASFPSSLWNLAPNYMRKIPGETVSDPRGRENASVATSLNGSGGWYYNSTTGDVKCNVRQITLPDNTVEYPMYYW